LIVRELAPAQQKARSRGAVAGWVWNPVFGLERRFTFIQDSRRRAMRVVVSVMMAAKTHRFLKLRVSVADVKRGTTPLPLVSAKY
jgi:hypothetical protein